MFRRWLFAIAVAPLLAAQPVRLHPENPHYYEFRGKPFLAVTSAEHYGALLNRQFDYRKYFDTLARDGMRLTRFFTGLYREVPGSFRITRNTLAPKPEQFVTPYARSSTPGALDGLKKWDLNKWNPEYWRRLKDLVAYAAEKGIITQVTLFCTYYRDEMWEASPLHPKNNVNGTPDVPRSEVLSLRHPPLYKRLDAFVRKIVTELNGFDNVTWEICNEPYAGDLSLDWELHVAQVIRDTEGRLGKRHLIARNVSNHWELVTDPSPNVDVLHFHYARPPVVVAMNYGLDRVIGYDETGFDGTLDAPYRVQAWDFILAGGGHFNHLDYSFAAGYEDGTFPFPKTQPGGGGPELRRSFKALIDFMERFDFIHMRPADELIADLVGPRGSMLAMAEGRDWNWIRPGAMAGPRGSARMLAGEGEYAVYIHHGAVLGPYKPYYGVSTAPQRARIALNVPAGAYEVTWWRPRTGETEAAPAVEHAGGLLWLETPRYREDIALELRRADGR